MRAPEPSCQRGSAQAFTAPNGRIEASLPMSALGTKLEKHTLVLSLTALGRAGDRQVPSCGGSRRAHRRPAAYAPALPMLALIPSIAHGDR